MHAWSLCALLVCDLAGCGRISFDTQPDAHLTSDVLDASTRACAWTTNPTLGPVIHHAELSIPVRTETDPLLVQGDPFTIYFGRDVANGPNFDVYVAHRPSLDSPFDEPQAVPGLSTGTAAELALQVDTTRHGYYVGGPIAGATDIYEVQGDTAGVFSPVRVVSELESGGQEYDPFSVDGYTLYFTAGPPANQDIFVATRASSAAPWSSITPFAHNTGGSDGGATTTRDGLVVVWASSTDSASPSDIYFATRAFPTDPWGAAQLLGPGTISGTEHDLEPCIREDGCELFFARSPSPADSNWDIYSVTLE